MDATIETVGDVVVIFIGHEHLDASNTKDFKRDVMNAINSQVKVVFDLSKVQFVDSSGCGAILSCLRHLNSVGGDLKLCNISKPVRLLFELVRMHRIFEIFNSRDEAINAFKT